ncbi:hscarg dehydrogenase, putative [Talaromyces stipitatus ATCC 10500]|uniref:Hscarg dehydrogenase, putative n=1 Tax=Talaromyces stipitatus (strain ATCC 10500 / CBS 375.48 / QM 6759 / NRRL 1006) TaxID=441959 RepID=B8MGB1_TALSN|nr:hscarg dehydrogenase, putative [Talaromyces stipitatus ATCC 10500]EED16231.1 hscarg dehydrogenase, putative [Talaromyces stipitatus ATCC 10500]
MTAEKPLLVVLGATGNQGGSVISHFLSQSPSPYKLRGVTRNPSSPNSIRLVSRGVEMVAGEFDDPSSLDAAFQGATAIFSVTDFWQSFKNPALREIASASGQKISILSRDNEAQQNRNIIDAAAKVDTLERFVYSSLPNTSKLSGGKYSHVYHFDGKAIAEEYGRSTHPKLWEKTNVLYVGYYLENYFDAAGGIFRPKLSKDKSTLILSVAAPLATSPLPMYSSIDDTGLLVDALLQASPGHKIIGAKQWLDLQGFTKVLGQVLGKNVESIEESPSFESLGDPDLIEDLTDMMGWCVEFGFDGGKVDNSVLQQSDLGVPVLLQSVEDWCRKQDWEKWLEVVE